MAGGRRPERTYDAKRQREKPWRAWYKKKEWYRLRAAVFKRDSVTTPGGQLIPQCRQTGVLLTGKHPAPNSPVADHIKRHNGDPNLFWDINNVQTVSKVWHDSVKQSQERRNTRKIGADGWPVV